MNHTITELEEMDTTEARNELLERMSPLTTVKVLTAVDPEPEEEPDYSYSWYDENWRFEP